jgi:hypothetical protein
VRPLPPFLRFERGEDTSYGHLLRSVEPDAHLSVLPHMVQHVPDPPRPRVCPTVPLEHGMPLERLATAWLEHCRFEPGAPPGAPRLRKLAKHLEEIVEADETELQRWVHSQWLADRATRWALLTRLVEERPDAPPYWTHLVLRGREELERGQMSQSFFDPGPAARRDGTPVWDALRGRMRSSVLLLAEWPGLVELTRELARKGVRLSRSVA